MRASGILLAVCLATHVASYAIGPCPCTCRGGRHRRVLAVVASDDDDETPEKVPSPDVDATRRQLQLEAFERCLTIANLESQAEAAEQAANLTAAIETYEALLTLQPPDSPGLTEEAAARRALQQLLLESAKRELEACEADEACSVLPDDGQWVPSEMATSFLKGEMQRAQELGEEARQALAMRALDDVRMVRTSVVRLLQLSEDRACEDADRAKGEQAYLRLVEGQPGWVAGWQLGEATRRRDDARLLRKSVEADLNLLELQLLRGDPSLAFLREVLRTTRDEENWLLSQSLWLQEQFESGALPRDPELLRTLLAQARRDPEQVVRLVTQAKDRRGQDFYARRKNDVSKFEGF